MTETTTMNLVICRSEKAPPRINYKPFRHLIRKLENKKIAREEFVREWRREQESKGTGRQI